MSNKEVLLKVDHLCQYFGPTKSVDDVSFSVYKGEVFGLVGESGCGKTTTGRSIINIYDITSGSVFFKGDRICFGEKGLKAKLKTLIDKAKNEKNPTIKNQLDNQIKKLDEDIKLGRQEFKKAKSKKTVHQIQMIFQDPVASLNPRMTVKEIISEGLIIKGEKDKKLIEEKVYEILELVGLVKEHATRYPHEFSGGQKQRIGIARSVIMQPEMIIADEPISALDVSIQAQVINLLNELREKLNLTILFIAHDLSVVKYFSDRIAVMYFGKIVELTTSEELFKNPIHPYTKSLLSAIPLPDPESEKNRVRITYNPLNFHDYSKEEPTLKEIFEGHFVYCNSYEENIYKQGLSLDEKK